jgi:osmotically-inducible protein OsmY
MKSDSNIKKQIEQALVNSLLSECTITVEVINGTVNLSGYVDKYCKKEVAKKIAQEVEGIRLVIENLSVILNDNEKRSDTEIAAVIEQKFSKNFGFAHKDINVVVKDGYVWLEGRLHWKYQRNLAVECISFLDGIKGIDNNIFIPETVVFSVKEKDVLAAIYSDYSITNDIKVEIFGQKVILQGSIKNSNQKNLVTRLVRSVLGVREVENLLTISEE